MTVFTVEWPNGLEFLPSSGQPTYSVAEYDMGLSGFVCSQTV